MPKLGAYTDDVLLAQWLVDEGEEVAAGRVVLELETEKTNAEVEAESAGFVHRLVAAGETVPIGTTVGADRRDARGVRRARGRRTRRTEDGEDERQPVPRLHRPRRRRDASRRRPAPPFRAGRAPAAPARPRAGEQARRSSRRARGRC